MPEVPISASGSTGFEVPPLPEIIHGSIAAVIEANITAYYLSFAQLPGAVLHRDSHTVWVDSGTNNGAFNAVVSADFAPDTVDVQIEAVLAHFRHHARPVTWHVGPTTTPTDLGTFLLAHGLVHDEDEPGMAVAIDQMREDGAVAPGLAIEAVQDDSGLKDWVDVYLFPLPADARRGYLDVLRQRGLGDDLPWRYYVGRLDGRPVATSELFLGAGVAAVHHVVTLPELRRRGIGTAMTHQALRDARRMEFQVGVLTASPDGIGSYRRIGFREYCWFHRYAWEP